MSPRDGQQVVCDLCRDRARQIGWVDPAAAGANVGRIPSPLVDESPAGRLERAASRFAQSEASHTVTGLIRTLGEPWVSIGAAAGSPQEVRVTVAWELCWYQWGIDLGDEMRPVYEIDRGDLVEQLDGSARQWNATATAEGRLTLSSPVAERG
jgi:hypothetical protein